MTRTSLTNNQERHHKVSTREQILTGGGGADSGGSKPSSPKFLFLLEFHALYFGNIEKSENFQIFKKNIKKSLRIQGGGGPGGCVPIPTGGNAQAKKKCKKIFLLCKKSNEVTGDIMIHSHGLPSSTHVDNPHQNKKKLISQIPRYTCAPLLQLQSRYYITNQLLHHH